MRAAGKLPSPSCLWHDTSPEGGGETRLSANPWWAAYSAPPLGGAGTAAAVTERASCQPHRPLPWLSPLRARPPRSLVSFWLPPTKAKVKVVGRCPTPCKLFEKSLSKNFMLALPWCFPHLSSSGTYFWSTGKARYAGRIIRPPVVSSSMRWAHQPAMRLTANMGVNKSSGMPSISYTSPE